MNQKNNNTIKKIIKIFLILIVLTFFIVGLHYSFLKFQYNNMKSYAEKIESNNKYTEITKFNENGGEPLFLTKKGNKVTIFFMEGFRTQNPSGMYKDWLEELFNKYNFNIVVPIYGIQSSPFYLRNRQWYFEEDLREIIQIYDVYCCNLEENHKIIVISQSFGALCNSYISLKGKRKPDYSIYLSPLNSFIEYKAAGPIVYWLSKQTSWLRHIFLFTKPSTAPNRKSVWDIVNEEKNLYYANNFPINPEDSAELGYRSQKAALFMEKEILPKIRIRNVCPLFPKISKSVIEKERSNMFVAWGDSDLYFSQKGFENFVNILTVNNKVEFLKLINSGHMVLLDNGEILLKDKILSLIQSLK